MLLMFYVQGVTSVILALAEKASAAAAAPAVSPLPKPLLDTLTAFVTRELQQAMQADPAAASKSRKGAGGAVSGDAAIIMYLCNILTSFIGVLPVSVVANLLQPLLNTAYVHSKPAACCCYTPACGLIRIR